MNKLRLTLSALAALVVTGSALAFTVKTNPNLYKCNVNTQKCDIKVNFSTFQSGTPAVNPGTLTANLNAPCTADLFKCTQIYTGQIWNNQ